MVAVASSRGEARRLLHDARAGRSRQSFAALEEEIAIGRARAHSRAAFAHQARHRERLGQGRRLHPRDRRGAPPRAGYPRRLLSLRRLVLDHQSARARQAVRERRRAWSARSPTSAAPSHVTITEFPREPQATKSRRSSNSPRAGVTPVEMFIRVIREGDAAGDDAAVIGQVDDRGRHQGVLQATVGDGRERRRHRLAASARRWHVPARARALRAREALAHVAGSDSQDDLAAGAAAGLERSRHDARGSVRRSGAVRSAYGHRPRDVRASRMELPAGIEKVFVNGELVWNQGKPTGARPGRVLAK